MFQTIHTTQVITHFGSGYVPEQHADPTFRNFAPAHVGEVIQFLRASMFSEVLKSLRSALSLR
jgi:hypothetical protein